MFDETTAYLSQCYKISSGLIKFFFLKLLLYSRHLTITGYVDAMAKASAHHDKESLFYRLSAYASTALRS